MALTDLIELTTTVTAQSGATVTLADVTGLAVNDRIIIEDTGIVYNGLGLDGKWAFQWFNGTENVDFPIPGAGYYFDCIYGKSFIGTISAINGNIITVDRTVPAGAVGLPCHRENGAAIKYHIENKLKWPKRKRFAVASTSTAPIRCYLSDAQHTIDFRHCEIFAPMGVGPPTLAIANSGPQGGPTDNKRYKNLKLTGNIKDEGFVISAEAGLYSQNGSSATAVFSIFGTGGPGGRAVNNVIVENFTFKDNWRSLAISLAQDCFGYKCQSEFTDPLRRYIQWEYQTVSSRRCAMIECTVDSPDMRAGFECFLSAGCIYIGCGGRNISFAQNTSGGCTYRDCFTTIDIENPDAQFSPNNPLFNSNRTIETQQGVPYPGTAGGTKIFNFVADYDVIPYPGTNKIWNIITAGPGYNGVGNETVIDGMTVTIPRTNVEAANNTGYAARLQAAGSSVTGLTMPTLDTGSAVFIQEIAP